MAEPLDRPLRSYYLILWWIQGKNWHQRAETEREGIERESKSQGWLWVFSGGSSVACRTLSNGSRMSVPICPNIDMRSLGVTS